MAPHRRPFFNPAAILNLFFVLFVTEKESAARFGETIRDTISTVIVALMINLITTVVELFTSF